MATTAADLRHYCNATDPDGDTFLATCVATATELVAGYVGTAVVPAGVVDRAVLEVGSELYHRRNAPNGVATFAGDLGGTTVRVARDPMVGAYPLLARYVGGPFS